MTKRILKEFILTRIAAVDRPCQEGAVVTLLKRAFSDKEREAAAKKGHALPDGSYPIKSHKDVKNAVKLFGHKPTATTKKHIIRNARRVGAVHLLPDKWNVKKYDTSLDWLAKQFAVFPFMVDPQEDDDDDAFDFDEAFEEAMEYERWCKNKDEIHPHTHALKCSIVSILSDPQVDYGDRMPLIRESIQQFVTSLEAKYPDLIQPMEAAITKHRSLALRKQVAANRINILKAKLKFPRAKIRKPKVLKPHGARAGGAMMRAF
jgi:hypothetical protein